MSAPILAIDPGIVCGWSLLGNWIKGAGKVEVIDFGSFKLEGRGTKRLARLEEQVQEVIADLIEKGHRPTRAVVERLEGFSYGRSSRGRKSLNQKALQTNREFTAIICLVLERTGIEVETLNPVGPNGWKRGMRSDLTQVVKMLWDIECDQHVADAIMMGNQFIRMRRIEGMVVG